MRFRRGSNHRNQGDPFNANFNQDRRNWRWRDNNPPFAPALAHMPPQPYGMNNTGMGPGVGMNMGNCYYPGGVNPMPHTAPLAYPSTLQPSPIYPATGIAAVNDNIPGTQSAVGTAHSASVVTVPGYHDRYYSRQPQPPRAASASPKSPEGIPSVAHWAEDVAKHHFVDEASVNEATLSARVDQSTDEEKRLFLEEYRYAGPQAQYEPPNCPRFTESDLEKEKRASSGDSGNGPEPEKEKEKETEDDNNGDSSKSKLRGDAPVFIPYKRRHFNWMVVSST